MWRCIISELVVVAKFYWNFYSYSSYLLSSLRHEVMPLRIENPISIDGCIVNKLKKKISAEKVRRWTEYEEYHRQQFRPSLRESNNVIVIKLYCIEFPDDESCSRQRAPTANVTDRKRDREPITKELCVHKCRHFSSNTEVPRLLALSCRS